MTNTTLKRIGVGIGVTVGYLILLAGVILVVYSFFLGYASSITRQYGVTAALLTLPFVYVVVDEYRTWLREQFQ